MTKRRWYRRKRLYVISGLVVLFLLWFTWESVTTEADQIAGKNVQTAARTALLDSVYEADRSSLIEMQGGNKPYYVPDYYSLDLNGYRNLLNLESSFLNVLNNTEQQMPLYRVTSLSVFGGYDSISLYADIRYPLFWIFTASDGVSVSLPVPHYPYPVK